MPHSIITSALRPTESILTTELPLLIISQSFPPVAEVGSLRVSRFCRYLPDFGVRPVVLSIDPQLAGRRDETLPTAPGTLIHFTTLWQNPLDLYNGWRKRSRSTAAGGESPSESSGSEGRVLPFVRRQRDVLLDVFQTPDRFMGWYVPATRAAARLVDEQNIAAVLSTGPAWTAHLIARHVRRRFKLPWLADFRDPWAVGNPWHRAAWLHRVDRFFESTCVRHADRVICITEPLRRAYVRSYVHLPERRFVTLTGGFDDIVPAPQPQAHAGNCLVHLGSIYADRRIDTFCEALQNLVREGRLTAGSFKVLFIGHAEGSTAATVASRFPTLIENSAVEFWPETSWRQGQDILWNADVLLLFQGNHRLQVPAKFYEYLPTGKPILAVAARGALTDLLDATQAGMWGDPDDVGQIAERIISALSRGSRSAQETRERLAPEFHYRALSARLARWVNELLAERRTGH